MSLRFLFGQAIGFTKLSTRTAPAKGFTMTILILFLPFAVLGFLEVAWWGLRWIEVQQSLQTARDRLGLRPLPADRDEAATELWRQHQVLKTDPLFVLENLSAFTDGRLAAAEEAWMTPGADRHARFYRKFHRALAGPSPLPEIFRAMQNPRSEAAAKAAATKFKIEQLRTRAITALQNLEAAEISEQRRYWGDQADELIDCLIELEPRFPPRPQHRTPPLRVEGRGRLPAIAEKP